MASAAALLSLPSAAAVCCFVAALWALRGGLIDAVAGRNKKKPCGCACSCGACGGPAADAADGVAEAPAGASMMEQMLPEIRAHALSFLDYPSLCRLSMTSSAMHRIANDDNAWKALYAKDFTIEQSSITPVNGWKAYYAATKAIIDVNAEFYKIIKEKSFPAMCLLWLQADYVKLTRLTGELFSGYTAVMNNWHIELNWEGQGFTSCVRDVRARVLGDMAWVTMKAGIDGVSWPFKVTNVFELHNGRWYMVLHHSSL